MRHLQLVAKFALASVLLLASGSCVAADRNDVMYERASALTKVTRAMAAQARRAGGTTVEEVSVVPDSLGPVLKQGTAHDPGLLTSFNGQAIRIRLEAAVATLLVCDAEMKSAAIEDVSCTPGIDRHHWTEAKRPCEFSIGTRELCR